MPTQVTYGDNTIRHDNHTAPASLTLRTFTQPANSLIIYNSDQNSTAELSFDGTNTFPLPPLSYFTLEASRLVSYYTKASAGTPELKVMYGSEK